MVYPDHWVYGPALVSMERVAAGNALCKGDKAGVQELEDEALALRPNLIGTTHRLTGEERIRAMTTRILLALFAIVLLVAPGAHAQDMSTECPEGTAPSECPANGDEIEEVTIESLLELLAELMALLQQIFAQTDPGEVVVEPDPEVLFKAEQLSGTTFPFSDGAIFDAGLSGEETELTFGNLEGAEGPFMLTTDFDSATGTVQVNIGSCLLEITDSDFQAGEGPQAGTTIYLVPCEVDGVTNGLVVENTDSGVVAHSLERQFVHRFVSIEMEQHFACALDSEDGAHCWGPTIQAVYDTDVSYWPGPFRGSYLANDHCSISLTTGGMSCSWSPSGAMDWAIELTNTDGEAPGPFIGADAGHQVYGPFAAIRATSLDTDSGTVEGWGNWYPQPPWETEPNWLIPVFASISVTAGFACGLQPSGEIICWPGADEPLFRPDGTFTEIDVGSAHGYSVLCAIRDTGELVCWSKKDNDLSAFAPIEGEFIALSVAEFSACAIRDTGEVECWSLYPDDAIRLEPPSGRFTAVDVQWKNACGIRVTGEIACWGQEISPKWNPPLMEGPFCWEECQTPGIYADSSG